MPTVLREGPYRFYFYSHESNEPAHIHVDRDTSSAKFWLNPVSLARNLGFGASELNRIERLVHENQTYLLEAWNGYFGIGRG
jgi:5-enolpyruvylshikimate-3-phosphate synthase